MKKKKQMSKGEYQGYVGATFIFVIIGCVIYNLVTNTTMIGNTLGFIAFIILLSVILGD